VALIALTAATASLDVTAFLRLGGVFASVMTSNPIFVSVAVVKTEAAFGTRCAVAIGSYIAGVAIGSTIAQPSGRENRLGTRPLSLLLTGELAILVGYTIWWMTVGGHPTGWIRLPLLGVIALAMGGQSAAARQLGNPNASTTYLTGTNLPGRQPCRAPPPRSRCGSRPNRPPRRCRRRSRSHRGRPNHRPIAGPGRRRHHSSPLL
jgi:uncharacterized membrane protein YoaK (UPF0700 family)